MSKLGATAPRTLLPSATDNPRGFWESSEIVEFHDELLASAGSRWDEWEPFNRDWLTSPAAQPFFEKVPELLGSEYGNARLLLLKDPRLCRLMPFWLEALRGLDIEPCAVIPLRHPGEVAASLEARNKFGRNQSLLIWLRHVLEAEFATRTLPRCFLCYGNLLQDWRAETDRLGRTLDLKWPRWSGLVEAEVDQYLSAKLRHQHASGKQFTPNPGLQVWLGRAHEALSVLAGGSGRDAAAESTLDGLREDFDRNSAIFASVLAEHRLHHQRSLSHSEESAKVLVKERDQARTQAQQAQDKLKELTAVGEANEGRLSQSRFRDEELQAKLQRAMDESSAAREAFQKRIVELQAQLDSAEKWKAQVEGLREDVQKKSREIEGLKAAHQKAIAGLATQCREWAASVEAEARKMTRSTRDLAARNGDQARRLAARSREIELLTRMLMNANTRISEGEATIADLQSRLAALGKKLEMMESSRSWRLTAPVRRLGSMAGKMRSGVRTSDSDAVLVRDSGLFDAAWYAQRYPDVAASGIEPLVHYLDFGGKEGRNPGPRFDAAFYLQANPDVAGSGMDPLMHFLRYGRSESRQIRPVAV